LKALSSLDLPLINLWYHESQNFQAIHPRPLPGFLR
jgi:hypothetical protein